MALIKLAAASAAAYGLYRYVTRRGDSHAPAGNGFQPATAGLAGGPTTAPQTPVGQGVGYVPPT